MRNKMGEVNSLSWKVKEPHFLCQNRKTLERLRIRVGDSKDPKLQQYARLLSAIRKITMIKCPTHVFFVLFCFFFAFTEVTTSGDGFRNIRR